MHTGQHRAARTPHLHVSDELRIETCVRDVALVMRELPSHAHAHARARARTRTRTRTHTHGLTAVRQYKFHLTEPRFIQAGTQGTYVAAPAIPPKRATSEERFHNAHSRRSAPTTLVPNAQVVNHKAGLLPNTLEPLGLIHDVVIAEVAPVPHPRYATQ